MGKTVPATEHQRRQLGRGDLIEGREAMPAGAGVSCAAVLARFAAIEKIASGRYCRHVLLLPFDVSTAPPLHGLGAVIVSGVTLPSRSADRPADRRGGP